MPKLVAKVEGRGNGIKTNIVNNVDIAKALDRPPECEAVPKPSHGRVCIMVMSPSVL